MDALAQGYGSDSESDSEGSGGRPSSQHKKLPSKATSTTKSAVTALNLLASNYSDDSSSSGSDNDDDSGNTTSKLTSWVSQQHKEKRQKITHGAATDDRKEHGNGETKTKKKQIIEQQQLPLPRLCHHSTNFNGGGGNPFDALILFEKDYISQLQLQKQKQSQHVSVDADLGTGPADASSTLLSTKLDTMYHTFHNDNGDDNHKNNGNHTRQVMSFARHLKGQKEFGNPHLFPSIIEHFNIDPLGSNCLVSRDHINAKADAGTNLNGNGIKNSKANTYTFSRFEYVENIVQKEEENRIRDCSINLS